MHSLTATSFLLIVCAAQSQVKRASRITSSRSFGTNVKSSSSNGISFDCPEEFGYYPHPTDCTQYYVCVFGGALLESCTGGLMYSHELQTCDWPRNVGCEVVDNSAATSSASHESQSRENQHQAAQQHQQHVPSRVRFGSAFSTVSAGTPSPAKGTLRPEYHRSPSQAIQAQVQTIPPPPELKVPPNPVITSRGQPKPLLDSHEDDIAKLYAEAHESLPAVEEEETDRQQRVYRGQPSTVSQVQRDRDGIIHQASINAIPNQGKIGSFAFGSQYRKNNKDLDYVDKQLDTNNNKTRRKRDLNESLTDETNFTKTIYQNDNLTETRTKNETDYFEASQEFFDDIDYDDYMDLNDTIIEESRRRPRQLRPSYAALRSRWPQPTVGSTKYRSTDSKKYQQSNPSSFSFGNFNPFLSPPSQSLNQLSPGYQVYQNVQQQSYTKKPKVVYTGYNLSLPPPSPPKIEDDFRPIVGYYNGGSTTTTHAPRPQTNLLPYILQSLKEITEHRNKVQAENFAYFHLDNDPITQNPKSLEAHTVGPILQYSLPKHSKPSQKVTPNSHYSPISTVGGFYNNNQQTLLDFKPTSKVTSRFNIGETQLPVTSTEPNYFQYNILANQPIKNYQANPVIGTEHTYWSTSKPLPIISSELSNKSYTLPEFHPSFSGGVISTATPTVTTQKSLLQLEFNIPEFVSSLQPTDLTNVGPQVMEMLKYFKHLNLNTKYSNGRKPIQQKLNNFKTTESVEPTTEQYRYRGKPPINKQQTIAITTTERPPKGYESFINSIPNQSTMFQTTTKQYANDYYEEQYPEEETLGSDSDDETHPPSKMPPYMPMSETMAPPRVQIMEPSTSKIPAYIDTPTTRRPYIDLKPLNFGQHTEQGQNQIPSFINFPSDFFQELKTRPPLKHEDKIESTTLATTTLRLTRPLTTPSSTTTKMTTRLISTTARSRHSLRPTQQRGHNKLQLNKVNTFKTRNNHNNNHNKNKTDFNVNSYRKQRPSAAPSTAALGTLNFNVNTNSDLDAQKNR